MAAGKAVLAVALCLLGVGCLFGVRGTSGWVLTSYPNLEKYFYMEEDLMSAADVFLREEYLAHDGQDVHDLKHIRQVLERAKHVHRRAGVHTERHLEHAVNAFHLVKRLSRDWPLALAAIRDSAPCKKWQLYQVERRLQNIEDNLPGEDVVQHLAFHLAVLQYSANVTTDSLKAGSLADRKSTLNMTASDFFDLARAAHLHKELNLTVTWAREALRMCEQTGCDEDVDGFNVSHALSMLASGFYKMGQIEEAIEHTEKLLKLDPGNHLASLNLRFYRESVTSEGNRTGVSARKRSLFSRYLDVCSGLRRKSPGRERRLKCYNSATRKKFIYEKVEVFNRKPLILAIHDIFRDSLSMAMKYLALRPFRRQSVEYNYGTPDYTVVAEDRTVWNWTQQANSRLGALKDTVIAPYRRGLVKVRSVGMEGMFEESEELAELSLGANIGVYSTFLDNVQLGGHVVFIKEKVRIPPRRGSAVFHFSSMSKLMICPSGLGINWMSHQSYREVPARICRRHEEGTEVKVKRRRRKASEGH